MHDMRRGLLGILGACLFPTARLFAQSVDPEPPDVTVELQDPPKAAYQDPPKAAFKPIMDVMQPACDCRPYRIWARTEYLLWGVKRAPLPVPLVTTGDPNNGFPNVNSAGAIGQQGTQILLGNSNVNFGATSGMRVTLGGWRDQDQIVGIEGSGFFLARRTNQFAAGSDQFGNPPLYFPAFNVVAGAERAVAISDPLRLFSGDVFVATTLRLWGAELNGVLNICRRPGLDVAFLTGFRYADLRENLQIHNTTTDLLFINTTVLNDHFDTRNQFYGGQIGSRVSWQRERWSVDVTGKIGLGSAHQVVNIQGDITQFGRGAFAPGTFVGGFFAQPTNIGRRTANEFSVMPAVELKIAYQLTERVRAVVGYDFIYWSQVVRPGDQIDRNINQTQSPIFGGGTLVGRASPTPLFNRTDFRAHGVNFGFEFLY
jgi:hypothetical protein